MATKTTVSIQERPLQEVKAEIVKRAGRMHPLFGIHAEDGERISKILTSLDGDEWARAWISIGLEYETKADKLDKRGADDEQLRHLYELAFHCCRIGRYPCANTPGKAESYRHSLRMYRKAAKYFDPPLEIVEVPFGDKKLIGLLQIPPGVKNPPIVMQWGGVDGWKEDRQWRIHPMINSAGMAALAIDMPGTGESPIVFTDAAADRTFSVMIDYLLKRNDIDGNRLGVWGGSYGGYWAAKLAFVEAKRLKGAVFHGSNVHYGFQEKWLRPALTEKASTTLFGPRELFDARSKAMGVTTLEEFIEVAPRLSLKSQGLLDKPSAPLLAVNGKLDDQAPIEDVYLLMEHGNPKEARIYPEGGHMGRGGTVTDMEICDMIIKWLKLRLAQ
jgi:esterase FrsA